MVYFLLPFVSGSRRKTVRAAAKQSRVLTRQGREYGNLVKKE